MRKRTKHSLSHYGLFTCDMGELIPATWFEVLPGDTIQHATSVLARLSPMIAPVMHPVNMKIHHWFVPYRLLWDAWENFITGGPDGNDASLFPTITINPTQGTLADYLGVTPGVSSTVSALPFRAYGLIWNEYYRDQDLQTARVVSTASGVDSTTATGLAFANWEKDYFTSARPWAQKGNAITLPLGTSAPVNVTGTNPARWRRASDALAPNANTVSPSVAGTTGNVVAGVTGAGWTSGDPLQLNPNGSLIADLTAATAASINDLRRNMALQRFAEARARYGSRYSEYLRYLGVRTNDSRLERPEYLGGGRQVMQISEVLQTAVTTSGTPNTGVGELKGHGIGAMRSNRYRRFFEEHGLIMSFFVVQPKTMYPQGLKRALNRRVRTDFYQRELEFIGQQTVLNKEVYAAHSSPDGTFGWQDRYDEYRREESFVRGDFRSSTLNFWHMAREFGSDPTLNSSFVQSNPTKRIHAVQTNDVLWVMANHSIQARRLLGRVTENHIY